MSFTSRGSFISRLQTSSKKCCDFDQLRQHVRSGAYATAEEFWHGLTHVWQSAIKLYPKDHTLHKAAITLRQIVQSHFRPALDHALSVSLDGIYGF